MLGYVMLCYVILSYFVLLSIRPFNKTVMLGNQDRSLTRVLLFPPIIWPLEVISRTFFDDFNKLNWVKTSCMFSTLSSTLSTFFCDI